MGEHRRKINRKRLAVTVGAAGALLAGSGTIAGASVGANSIPDAGGEVHVCYPTNGTLKPMYLIDTAQQASCPTGYTELDINPNGTQGPQGAQGPQGPIGPRGLQGAQGAQGPQGPIGPRGFQGAQGAQGTQGAQGAQGAQGPQGVQGSQGPQGAQGSQGAQGAQGAAGPQGVFTSSSGAPVVLSVSAGAAQQAALLPVSGAAAASVTAPTGSTFDTTSSGGLDQVFPRDLTVTTLSARLSTTVAATLAVPLEVRAQLWVSTSPGSNLLSPTSLQCHMDLSGVEPVGTVVSCSATGPDTPVAAGTVGVIVFTAFAPVGFAATTGDLQAGLTYQ